MATAASVVTRPLKMVSSLRQSSPEVLDGRLGVVAQSGGFGRDLAAVLAHEGMLEIEERVPVGHALFAANGDGDGEGPLVLLLVHFA